MYATGHKPCSDQADPCRSSLFSEKERVAPALERIYYFTYSEKPAIKVT
jgi:hypothetical protein